MLRPRKQVKPLRQQKGVTKAGERKGRSMLRPYHSEPKIRDVIPA